MTTTCRTGDLRTDTILIKRPSHSARNGIIKTWPSAMAVELSSAMIERRSATTTQIGAGLLIINIFAAIGDLRSLIDYDCFLFRSQRRSLIIHRAK